MILLNKIRETWLIKWGYEFKWIAHTSLNCKTYSSNKESLTIVNRCYGVKHMLISSRIFENVFVSVAWCKCPVGPVRLKTEVDYGINVCKCANAVA